MKLQLLRLLGSLAAGLFFGIVVVSIGVGSMFTSLNTVMSPMVCPGDVIVPAWEYRPPKGRPALASGPDIKTRWICVDQTTHQAHIAGYRTVFTAGTIYGLIIAAILWWFSGRQIDALARGGSKKRA